MEQRLKKQRNRLFLRVTLILLAAWLAVSAVYCAIRLYTEKADVQNRELANLSRAKQQLSTDAGYSDLISRFFLSYVNLMYPEDGRERNRDTQIIVTDMMSGEIIADTAGKVDVRYGIKTGTDSSSAEYGFLDYKTVRDALSDEQFQTISEYLNTERSDGRHYELVCTKLYLDAVEIIPAELKIVLTEGENTWFQSDEIVETFTLDKNMMEGETVFECDDMRRNTVPKDFLLDGMYNRDCVGLLTEEQKEKAVATVATGPLEYIFYATDYSYLSEKNAGNPDTASVNDTYCMLQYAKRIRLWDNCKGKLVIGVSAIFGFFFIIGLILCLMIWKMVKSQILQEQKRTDLTNALAHDIKTPLFVISGYAYSLKEDIDAEERDSYLDRIIEQTDEINGMVHKMLNLSKLDSYRMTLNLKELDLCETVENTLRKYTSLPDGRTISLTHSGSNIIRADSEWIQTVLQNLIDNAVKYSLKNSGIQIDVTDKTLRISNPSEPLTKAELKQIWEPFVRKDKSRHKNGNGLGLSIVKSVLDLHGAKHEAKQKDGIFSIVITFAE